MTYPPPESPTSQRRWSWSAFIVGLAVGVPIGAVGIIVLMQIVANMIAMP